MSLGSTVDSVLNRVRRHALLTLRGPAFLLDSTVAANATSLTLSTDPTGVGPGSLLAIDLELCYVVDVPAGSRTVQVIRGWLGTTPQEHVADTMVEVDPRTPKVTLIDFAEQEIRSWEPRLWQTITVDVAANTNERTYNLPVTDGFLFLLDIRRPPLSGTRGGWTGDAWIRADARVLRGLPFADFASGYALQLGSVVSHPAALRVTYAAPFNLDSFTLGTDLISAVGLRPNMLDVLDAGIEWRVLSSGQLARTDWRSAGMSRDAEEVTPIDVLRAAELARSLRDKRLAEAAQVLRNEHPYRSTG